MRDHRRSPRGGPPGVKSRAARRPRSPHTADPEKSQGHDFFCWSDLHQYARPDSARAADPISHAFAPSRAVAGSCAFAMRNAREIFDKRWSASGNINGLMDTAAIPLLCKCSAKGAFACCRRCNFKAFGKIDVVAGTVSSSLRRNGFTDGNCWAVLDHDRELSIGW